MTKMTSEVQIEENRKRINILQEKIIKQGIRKQLYTVEKTQTVGASSMTIKLSFDGQEELAIALDIINKDLGIH